MTCEIVRTIAISSLTDSACNISISNLHLYDVKSLDILFRMAPAPYHLRTLHINVTYEMTMFASVLINMSDGVSAEITLIWSIAPRTQHPYQVHKHYKNISFHYIHCHIVNMYFNVLEIQLYIFHYFYSYTLFYKTCTIFESETYYYSSTWGPNPNYLLSLI